MREHGIFLVAGSVFLVNAVVLAGCMQDKGGVRSRLAIPDTIPGQHSALV
jgi:hypothetical protein